MTILLLLLLLLALYLLQKLLYRRFWHHGLRTEVRFTGEYAQEEQEAELTETIVNDKLLPLPVLEIDFHMDKGLRFRDEENASVSDRSYRRDVFALGVRQRIVRTLRFRCVRRGYYRIDETGLCARDLLLTDKYFSSQPQSTEFYVLPKPAETGRLSIPFSHIMGSLLSRKKVYDDPFTFAGLREYARTDSMKEINWKATARTGALLVNMRESTLSQKVVVLLDMEGLGVQSADLLNEAVVRVACSICERLLREGVPVDVLSNGTDVLTGKPMKALGVAGAGSVLPLKKQFACLQAGNGLPAVWDCFPEKQRTGLPAFYLLLSRSTGEELVRRFSAFVGKDEAMHIIPFRQEHPEKQAGGNVKLYWYEA